MERQLCELGCDSIRAARSAAEQPADLEEKS